MRLSFIAIAALYSSAALAAPMTLSEVYRLALANDPALSGQMAIRDAASARDQQTRAARGLSVDASASAQSTQNLVTDNTTETGALSVTLSVPVYNRELNASISAQSAQARGAEATFDAYRQTHIVTVAEAYFAVLSAEQDLAAAQAEVTAFERQLEQAEERLSVGIGTRVDVDQARARLDVAQVSVISSEVALESAQSDLVQLLDQPVTEVADLKDTFAAEVHRENQRELSRWVQTHPSVVAKQQALASAYASLDQARAETTPSVALSSKFSVSDTSGSATPSANGTARSNVLSMTVTAPLFTNGARDAGVAVAMAGVEQAKADLLAAERSVRSSIVLAFRSLEASARTVEARQLAIVSAASRLEATEAAYAVGAGDIVEVLNAQKDLIAAERDWAKARHTHVIRQLQFDQALGDLSDQAIARIDQSLQ